MLNILIKIIANQVIKAVGKKVFTNTVARNLVKTGLTVLEKYEKFTNLTSAKGILNYTYQFFTGKKLPKIKSIADFVDLKNNNSVLKETLKITKIPNKKTIINRIDKIEKSQAEIVSAVEKLKRKGIDISLQSSHFKDKTGKLVSVENFVKNSYKEILEYNGGDVVNTYNNLSKRLTAIADEMEKTNNLVKRNQSWDLGDISKDYRTAAKETKQFIKDVENGLVRSDKGFVSLNERIRQRAELGEDEAKLLGYDLKEGEEPAGDDWYRYKEYKEQFKENELDELTDDGEFYDRNPYGKDDEWITDFIPNMDFDDIAESNDIIIEYNPSDPYVIENIDIIVPDNVEEMLKLRDGLIKMKDMAGEKDFKYRMSNRYSSGNVEKWCDNAISTLDKMIARR